MRKAETVTAVGVLSKIELWARHAPSRLAYLDGRQRKLSYKELVAWLGRCRGEILQRDLAGKRIGILLADPYDLGLAVLSVMGLATAAPLTVDQPLSLLRREATRLHLDALLVAEDSDLDLGLPTLSFRGGCEPVAWCDEAPALLLSTSGSTGAAKTVELSHSNLLSATDGMAQVLELAETDRCWGNMPLFHIHGLSALFKLNILDSILCNL